LPVFAPLGACPLEVRSRTGTKAARVEEDCSAFAPLSGGNPRGSGISALPRDAGAFATVECAGDRFFRLPMIEEVGGECRPDVTSPS
jgi:hypothetical protein